MTRRHVTPRLRSTLRAGQQQARLDAWASHVEPGITVAELARAWWPEVGDPLGWRHGSYPRSRLAQAWRRVRQLERARLVVVEIGPLRHRSQVGATVRLAERQEGMWGGAHEK